MSFLLIAVLGVAAVLLVLVAVVVIANLRSDHSE
jgi:hypothetical protein